jgi:hypothetical protein
LHEQALKNIDEYHERILEDTLYTIHFLDIVLIGYNTMSIHGESYIGENEWDNETDEAIDAWHAAVVALGVENPFIKVSVDM